MMVSKRVMAVSVTMIAVVCLAVGVGVGLLIAPTPAPSVVVEASGASVMTVSAQGFDGRASSPVTPMLADKREHISQASGVARESQCVPGAEIVSGSSVMTVNDSPIMALHLASPPWRDLAPGLKGPDVKEFQEELARLGYSVTADGDYATGTARAAEKLWNSLGVKKQTGLPLSGFVWLPDVSAVPASCDVAVGDMVSPGMALFTTGGSLAGLKTTGLDDPASRVVVSLDGTVTAPVDEGGVITDAGFLANFEASPNYKAWQSSGQAALTVTTKLARPLQVVSVPPSSLYAVNGSSACVTDQSGESIPVHIVASQLGQTFVTADPSPTTVAVPAPKDPPSCG